MPQDEWELYVPEGPRRTQAATGTIGKDGTMSLNRAAWEAIGKPDQVNLYYNAAHRHVAVRRTQDGDPAAINIKKHVDRYYRISVLPFVRKYGIPHDPSRRYRAQHKTGTVDPASVVIDLNAEPDWVGDKGGKKKGKLQAVVGNG